MNNKERNKKNYLNKVKRNKKIVTEYKLTHPCTICGESRIPCLDFHHVNGTKETGIGEAIIRHISIKRLKAEMEKCIVVCANCHRIIHSIEFS